MADKWKIQPVCMTCHYRRKILATNRGHSKWENTACYYFLDTGELRDGKPEGNYCPNYIRRGTMDKIKITIHLETEDDIIGIKEDFANYCEKFADVKEVEVYEESE